MNKIYSLLGMVLLLFVLGCSDDFLERIPQEKQTEMTAFQTNENFQTYAWSLYDILYKDYSWSAYGNDPYTDNMYSRSGGIGSWEQGDRPTPSSGAGWSFSSVRKVNLMLDNIDGSQLSDDEKAHWKSVGYFFRAYKYIGLVSMFGDVPWLDRVVTDGDADVLYAPRTPRNEVTTHILEDLQFAAENIKDQAVSNNVINVDVVNALISRFGLFEGTWRKYHGLGDEQEYFAACVKASEALIARYPNLSGNLDAIFNSEDLSGVDGVLLHRKFVEDKVTHGATRLERTSASYNELTKEMVNSFLCSNGKTIEANGRRADEPNAYTEFRDRDYRLYFMTPPPYLVTKTGMRTWDELGVVDGVDHSEYIRVMEGISDEGYKRLPVLNWNDFVTTVMPHYEKAINGQGFCKSKSGYWAWKYYNDNTPTTSFNNTTDFSIFRMGEVLINYAEVKKELGQFDQILADATINKLRARVNVAPMIVADVDGGFDTKRDADVDPVMWEIRRERRVELLGEGFRFNDLRRWKKCEYMLKRKVGAYIEDKDQSKPYRIRLSNVVLVGGGTTGYAEMSSVLPQATWPEYYYLYPIPKNQLILNKNIKQNPEWETVSTSEEVEE